MEQGIPGHDTFGRVFARRDTAEFLSARHAWVDEFAGSLRGLKEHIRGQRLRAGWDETVLNAIYAGFSSR